MVVQTSRLEWPGDTLIGPVANQAVIAGGEHDGATMEEQMVRTDRYGVARITLDAAGKW